MLFASFDFVLFFLPVLLAYWALARHPLARWLLLLGSSYFFYCASARPPSGGWPTPWYFVGLIVASTIVDYLVALGISRSQSRLWRNVCLGVSLVGNLGMLGYFKYSGFLLDVARDLAEALGLGVALPSLRVALPIGISFYTFQSLSYTIDVWRSRIPAERNFLRFAVYVAFFPQLVAGPIVRASEFMPQVRAASTWRSFASPRACSRRSCSAISSPPTSPTWCSPAPRSIHRWRRCSRCTPSLCKSTRISPATRTWPSAWLACWASSCRRTSIARINRATSASSGGAGT
jgi:D-alanyl-lipoteichoic acid acyltransferase DltB (MBOAT superfamily)